MISCACGSELSYEQCCGKYIDEGIPAPSPEALMRSRYTAYTLANIDYVKKTMRGKLLREFNAPEAKQWALTSQWQGLDILDAPAPKDDVGFVTFVARFIADNEPQAHYEKSEFKRYDERWYYVKEHPYKLPQAQVHSSQKVGRNDPCFCGSGKKYKKCCAA